MCVARSYGCRACAGDDGWSGRRLCATCTHGGGRIGGICAHSQTFIDIHKHSGGAEVHAGCADGEAGNPAPSTSIVFPPGPVAQVLAYIGNAKSHDADLLAAPAAASKRRGRCHSRAVRPELQHCAPNAGGDAACESRPVRAPSETLAAHKNGNWSDESLQAAMNAVTNNGMPLR